MFEGRIFSRTEKKGFTLIELLIVIAIILILIAIALPNFLEAQVRARITKAKSEIRSLGTAYESYRTDFNLYPRACIPLMPSVECQHNWGFVGYGGPIVNGRVNGYITTPVKYINEIPDDLFAVNYEISGSMGSFPPGHPWVKYRATRRIVWNRDDPTATIPPPIKVNEQALHWRAQYDAIEPTRFRGKEYLISSLGPDHIESILPAYHIGSIIDNGGAFYSPTNGTVSKGDLVYLGPGGLVN